MGRLCMNCMKKIDKSKDICPYCGQEKSEKQEKPFLPFETTLQSRYIIGRGLEMNGEGLGYIGYDKTKDSKIYIREFFPQNLCERAGDLVKIKRKDDKIRIFDNLMLEFLKCFRSVAKIRNLPSITSVYDIFTENGTAYVVMEWIEGTSLDRFLSKTGGYMHWDKAKLMFMPLLSSLIQMENFGIRHLGISPANMLVTEDRKIKLTGFATKALRSAYSEIDCQLYDGCSALEQYSKNYEPSEATDIYGFMSSLFLAVTGEYPMPAQKRINDDRLLITENILNELPDNVVSSFANALKVSPSNRTLSFESLRIELSNSPVLRVKGMGEPDENFEPNFEEVQDENEKKENAKWGIISCISALALLLVGLGVYLFILNNTGSLSQGNNDSENQGNTIYQMNEPVNPEAEVQKFTVPNLVGRNYNTLQEEVAKGGSNYKLVLLSDDFSDNVGEGCVISQIPTAGEEAAVGSTIAVNISKGSQKRTVPAVKGKTLSEASQLITNAKLTPVKTSEYSKEYPEGIVMGYKNCNEGDQLNYGSEVVIIVSKGSM
ncbi:MAG: PASTA domain-containing protein [Clostridia bacterium]|nr:PASTA domain-containing protein [Clostridia bacterium]